MRIRSVLRWAALISGTLVLAFVLFMTAAEIIGALRSGGGTGFRSAADGLHFLLFPVCLMIGLALAYRWPLVGGMLVVGSMLLLCLLRHDLVRSGFFVWATPGLLYLAHALVIWRSTHASTEARGRQDGAGRHL